MNGPAHYQKAEHLLKELEQLTTGGVEPSEAPEVMVEAMKIAMAQAQVHATLALAAAAAQLDAYEGPGGGSATGRSLADVQGWEAVFDA